MKRRPSYKYYKYFIFCMLLSCLQVAKASSTNVYLTPIGQKAIIDTTICEGNCVVFDNIPYCEEGTYTLQNKNILKVNLMPSVQQTSVTICDGESYPGQDWSTPGRYSYQASVGACAITVWVDLKVAQPKSTYINEQIRYGECFDFGPNSLCLSGKYELRYTSGEGCDSTVYINLVIEDLLIDTLPSVSVCAGDSYTPNGIDTTLTKSGLYQFHGTTAEGRPTLTILNFRVKNEIITHLNRSACEESSFIYNGQILDETKIYEFNYTSAEGCDSLVLLDLKINKITTTTLNEIINPDAFLVIGNNVVNLAGSYEFIFTSKSGCDSIVQLNLGIRGTPDSLVFSNAVIEEEICTGLLERNVCLKDLPYEIGQSTFWQGGSFELAYPAPDGCASSFGFNLIVERKITSLKESICEGSSYIMNGVEYFNTGIYSDTLFGITSNRCDSIIYLDLTVVKPKDTIVSKVICWGEPLVINGQFVTQSGKYNETFKTRIGCDSIVTTNLTIVGGLNLDVEKINLCAGDSYSDDIGNNVHVSGLYNFKFVSTDGCDSIVTIDLWIPDTIKLEIDTFFCEGEYFDLENFSVNQSGTYREFFKNGDGCDSIVQYNLTLIDCEINTVQNADTIICGGNTGEFSFKLIKGQAPFTYQWQSADSLWRGQGSNLDLEEEIIEEGLPSGAYEIIVTDINGQTAILNIEIFRPEIITAEWIVSPLIGNAHLACNKDSTAFLEIMPSGGVPPYRYQWNNGVSNTNRIENLSAGNYIVTITDDYNCPYISSQEISEPPFYSFSVSGDNPTCDNFNSGLISISGIQGGTAPYEYRLEGMTGFSNRMNYQYLKEGEYTITAKDQNDCQLDTTISIVSPEVLTLDYESDIHIKLGEHYDLNIFSSSTPETILWKETEGLSCNDCLDVTLNPLESITYNLTVTSIDGCETTEQFNVLVSRERYLFIPNAFSPNLDGLNDRVTVFGNHSIDKVELFQIFSRWGELLYESENLELNNEQNGWDGCHNGRKVPAGVYIWKAKITFIDGGSKMYSGDVLLVK